MAPSTNRHFDRRDDASGGTAISPILVAGIVIIILCALVLVAGIVYRRVKKSKAANEETTDEKNDFHLLTHTPPKTGFSRAQMTMSVVLPALAPRAMIAPTTTITATPSAAQLYAEQHAAPLPTTDQAIVDHHIAQQELPTPFAPFKYNFGSDPADEESGADTPEAEASPSFNFGQLRASRISITSQAARRASTYSLSSGNPRVSHISLTPSPLRPDTSSSRPSLSSRDLKHSPSPSWVSERPGGHRLSVLSVRAGRTPGSTSSFRFPFPNGSSSPRVGSVLSSHSSNPSSASSSGASPANGMLMPGSGAGIDRVALHDFTPLLPDELVVSSGDKLAVLQSFDDGWCVCAREVDNSASGLSNGDEKEIHMGCVPLWVFDFSSDEGEMQVGVRQMRSTSLAITVEMLAAPGPGTNPARRTAFGAGEEDNDASLEAPVHKPWERDNVISWSNF